MSNGTAGEQAVPPTLEQLSPFGLEPGSVATAVILCIFIYWGWDACLAVTEETKDADRTPGRAALISTVILLATYVLVAYAVGSFAGYAETGIGLGNEENADDVLTIVGEPVLGAIMTSVLLLTVAVSAAASTQTTILPTARGALAMAVYKAIPAKFGEVHPRYKTPGFATLVMGATAIGFYLILSLISTDALADSIASLGWPWRSTTGSPPSPVWSTSAAPCSAAPGTSSSAGCCRCSAGSAWCPPSSWPRSSTSTRSTPRPRFGPLGGIFVIGIGMLALGVPLMIACAVRLKAFFRGETLNADTPILVPDTGEPPRGGL